MQSIILLGTFWWSIARCQTKGRRGSTRVETWIGMEPIYLRNHIGYADVAGLVL